MAVSKAFIKHSLFQNRAHRNKDKEAPLGSQAAQEDKEHHGNQETQVEQAVQDDQSALGGQTINEDQISEGEQTAQCHQTTQVSHDYHQDCEKNDAQNRSQEHLDGIYECGKNSPQHRTQDCDRNSQTCAPRLDQFQPLQVLGEGGFGRVFLVKKKDGADSGKLYAVKTMDIKSIKEDQKSLERHETECYVHRNVAAHPFLVGMHYYFRTESKVLLMLDYCSGGDLFEYMRELGPLPEKEARLLLAEIVLGVQHLHELGVMHRDLKPENILLFADGHLAITDFGFCKKFRSGRKKRRSTSYVGTIFYLAPEVIERKDYGPEVDWWCVGVIAFQMLSGYRPFRYDKVGDNMKLFESILCVSPVLPDYCSNEARNFVFYLMLKKPALRLGTGKNGAEDVRKDPFFSGINWEDVYHKRIHMPYLMNDAIKDPVDETLKMELRAHSSDGVCQNRVEKCFYVAETTVTNQTSSTPRMQINIGGSQGHQTISQLVTMYTATA
jgi:serine/threonine protein kinase